MAAPKYGGLDTTEHIDEAAEDIIQWIDEQLIDLLTIEKCDEDAVIPFLKNLSKLSSILSVEIESLALSRLTERYSDELPSDIEWRLNERVPGEKYPDLALVDESFDPPSNWVWPGIEIKAWCPFATEITGRMKKGQSIMEQYPDQLLLIAWVPEHLIYGQPKVVGTWLGDGSEMARSRDNYWFDPPKSIILEPDFSPERDPSEQHTNVDRFKWDDDDDLLKEAEERAKELGIFGESYEYNDDFQSAVRTLYSEYEYNHGTNFWKLQRLHHEPLENFPDNLMESTHIKGKSLADWDKHLRREEPEPFAELLRSSQTTL